MRRQLQAVRSEPETAYIVDALLTLHEEAERRHKERLRQRTQSCRRSEEHTQQAAAGGPTSVRREPAAKGGQS